MVSVQLLLLVGMLAWPEASGRPRFSEKILSVVNLTEALDVSGQNPKWKICGTEACKKSAWNILESIDFSVDPCEDFYAYACGSWMRKHRVPPTENHWNQFDILDRKLDSQIHEMLKEESETEEPEIVKMAKKAYRACMDTDRIEKRGLKPLAQLLEEFGNWPVATLRWDESKFNWQKLVGDVGRKLGISTLLLIYVDVDRKNTSRNVLIVEEPSLGLPKYMLSDSDFRFVEPYVTFMSEAAEAVTKARGEKTFHFGVLYQSFRTLKFEMELAKAMRSEEDKRNAEDLYHLVTIKKLQEWTDGRTLLNPESRIDWKFLVNNLVQDGQADVTDETLIVVTDWDFLAKLMDLIDATSSRTLGNFILWRVVNELSRDLNREMQSLNFRFKSQLSNVEEDQPRWRDCVLTTGYLSFVVGYMYVRKHFSKEAKTKAVSMVEDIRSAFKQELAEVPWMDDDTKKQAIEKADFMNHFIGYPNWYENITVLERYYKGVEITEDHFENKLRLRRFLARNYLDDFDGETDRDQWVAGPAIANAFYNPQLNSIIFPAGVLQDPFFDENQPEALNYGSIGAVVGHEITHGFDDTGRQSDKFGNIKQWWTKETEKTYLENARCFVNQYRRYRVPELDALLNTKVTMNGVSTLDENIADNGGLRAALRAYKTHRHRGRPGDWLLPGLDHLTPDHLFYVGFARVWCESHTPSSLLGEVLGDSHAPHRFRVIGSLSNSEHFAHTWRCKPGSYMNPKDKCKLW